MIRLTDILQESPKDIYLQETKFTVEIYHQRDWSEYDETFTTEKEAIKTAKEIANNSGDKVRVLKNGKKVIYK